MSNDVTVIPPDEPHPVALIQQALDAKIAPADMKELFDLQVRYEQRRAEEAYADAITAFQAEMTPIRNEKEVKDRNGRTLYRYAPLDHILRVAGPILRKYRIVYTFDTALKEGLMSVACRIRVGVVEKVTWVTLAVPDGNPIANEAQKGKSAVTFGQRTSFIAALGIITTDEDDDSQALAHDDSAEPCTPAELDELNALMAECERICHRKINIPGNLAWLNPDMPEEQAKKLPLSSITKGQRRKWMADLRQKISAAKAKEGGAA